MKATELMIGDWVVLVDPDTKKRENVRVHFADLSCGYILGLFEPIPITPEILKRNGLELSSTGSHFNEDKDYLLEISFYKNEILWTINLNEYDILKLEYVHELQHALKLCRIEKTIQL